jgi:conjugative transfer signal peptidase TraF
MRIYRYYPLITGLIVLIVVGLIKHWGIVINTTSSMPEGLYLKQASTTIERGDVVAIFLKPPYQTIGIKQGYLKQQLLSKTAIPLIKQVVAVPGDTVELTDSYISVNGHRYPYKTYYVDSHHRPLTVYPRGTYHAQGYWLIGTADSHSWDSRYWGEVAQEQILYPLKPWLIKKGLLNHH